jgi:hypothetical protein
VVVRILGGGIAGSAAALAARALDRPVELIEKAKYPRHKVCGEFLSSQAVGVLDKLKLKGAFLEQAPACLNRVILHFKKRSRTIILKEPGYGLSRYVLDDLLFSHALVAGAQHAPLGGERPNIIASGRVQMDSSLNRLFAFKAHFEGAAGDAEELFFFSRCFVSVTPIEKGFTNICGLAPEHMLHRYGFDFDTLLDRSPALRARIRPLKRQMNWMRAGPIVYESKFGINQTAGTFYAGDALAFTDPYTGSGIAAALESGRLAGECCARGVSTLDYMKQCRKMFEKPFQNARRIRSMIDHGRAEQLALVLPAGLVFSMTRPRIPD